MGREPERQSEDDKTTIMMKFVLYFHSKIFIQDNIDSTGDEDDREEAEEEEEKRLRKKPL